MPMIYKIEEMIKDLKDQEIRAYEAARVLNSIKRAHKKAGGNFENLLKNIEAPEGVRVVWDDGYYSSKTWIKIYFKYSGDFGKYCGSPYMDYPLYCQDMFNGDKDHDAESLWTVIQDHAKSRLEEAENLTKQIAVAESMAEDLFKAMAEAWADVYEKNMPLRRDNYNTSLEYALMKAADVGYEVRDMGEKLAKKRMSEASR